MSKFVPPPDEPRGRPTPTHTVLVVDDEVSLRTTLSAVLEAEDYRVLTAPEGAKALRLLQQENVDLVLTDLVMPGMRGEQLLTQVRQTYPDIPVVAMTSFPSVTSAAAVTRLGAAEYLTKPLDARVLRDVIRQVLLEWEPHRLRRNDRLAGRHLEGIVGRSRVMQQLFQQVSRVSATAVPVLITGETGTGKELIAQATHRASGRGAFVPVNCGAIPAGVLESELFGHVRGAFTGADRDRVGLFEAADGGTLFLDEIAELPLTLQSKLLRVLQSGEFRRVGEVNSRQVDVRLIAATHRDLEAYVAAGEFREDLFYRINVLRLLVPALRERTADIPLLAEHFLQRIAARGQQEPKQYSPAAAAVLVAYSWPGNVRQLQNTVERSVVFSTGITLDIEDLPSEVRAATVDSPLLAKLGTELTLAEIEREHILGVLARVGGNRARAARLLGLPRRTLYRRLEEYGESQ